MLGEICVLIKNQEMKLCVLSITGLTYELYMYLSLVEVVSDLIHLCITNRLLTVSLVGECHPPKVFGCRGRRKARTMTGALLYNSIPEPRVIAQCVEEFAALLAIVAWKSCPSILTSYYFLECIRGFIRIAGRFRLFDVRILDSLATVRRSRHLVIGVFS